MNNRRTLLAAAFAPALTLLVYLPSLPGDFIFDDALLIERSRPLRELDLQRVFWDNYWGSDRLDVNWRPAALLSYALNFRLGESALGFHLVNLALAAAASLAAFALLRRLTGSDPLAALGAALWGVMPIHAEAVANIVGRAELLAALAVMLVWRLALAEEERGRSSLRALALAGVLFFIALASKESAVVLLAIAPLGALLLRKRLAWRTLAAAALALGLYLVLRHLALAPERATLAAGSSTLVSRVDNPLYSGFTDPFTRALNGLRLLGHYAALTLLPRTLSADYSFDQVAVLPIASASLWLQIAAYLLPTLLGTALLWRRHPLAALGLLFFPVAFAVTSNVLMPIGTIFGERLAFLPSLALPLLLVGLVTGPAGSVASSARARRIVTALLGLAILLFSARTAARAFQWRDRAALYEATMRDSPRSARAWLLGAAAALERSRESDDPAERDRLLEAAIERSEHSLQISPHNGRATGRRAEAHFARAEEAAARARAKEAIVEFRQAEEGFTKALEELRAARQSEPKYLRRRAEARLRQGRFQEAIADLDRYLAILARRAAPPDAFAHGFRGVSRGALADALARQGKKREAEALRRGAREDLDRAIELRPDLPEFFNNRGYLRYLEGDLAGAEADYREGLRICREAGVLFDRSKESVWSFRRKLAQVLRARGDAAGADREERAARELEK